MPSKARKHWEVVDQRVAESKERAAEKWAKIEARGPSAEDRQALDDFLDQIINAGICCILGTAKHHIGGNWNLDEDSSWFLFKSGASPSKYVHLCDPDGRTALRTWLEHFGADHKEIARQFTSDADAGKVRYARDVRKLRRMLEEH